MREQLLARMRSLGSLQPPAEATACLEVCVSLVGEGGWGGVGGGVGGRQEAGLRLAAVLVVGLIGTQTCLPAGKLWSIVMARAQS